MRNRSTLCTKDNYSNFKVCAAILYSAIRDYNCKEVHQYIIIIPQSSELNLYKYKKSSSIQSMMQLLCTVVKEEFTC